MAKKRDNVYSFDKNLKSTRLTEYAKYKPFRAREAFLLRRRLGRPLTEAEMKQFEYNESDDREIVNIPVEISRNVRKPSENRSSQRKQAALV